MSNESAHSEDRKPGAVYIDWKENDAEHPLNWSVSQKWSVSLSVMIFTFVSTSMPSGYYMAYEGFEQEHKASHEVFMLGIFFYLLGHAFAPMVLAPISESIGRYPVMMVSSFGNLVLFFGNIYAPNIATLVVTRGLQGFIGSTSNCMSGGLMADMFSVDKRGVVLSCYTLIFFAASSLSPLWASWVAFKMTWRWIFWIQAASCLVSFLLLVAFLREPRPDVLLMNRARRATKETGIEHRTDYMDANPTLFKAMQTSMARPFVFLTTEPVVIFYSLWMALVCGCSYFLLSAIPLLFDKYGWSMGEKGLPHLGSLAGTLAGFFLCITLQESLFARDRRRSKDNTPLPESRLYLAMAGAILFPLGSFMLALTSIPTVHWIWPIVSLSVIALGCFPVFLSGYTYLADAYETYASSALAAAGFLKNLTAAVVPLFARHAIEKYGDLHTCSVVGCVATLLAPYPLSFSGNRVAMALCAEHDKRAHRLSSVMIRDHSFTLLSIRREASDEESKEAEKMAEGPAMQNWSPFQ